MKLLPLTNAQRVKRFGAFSFHSSPVPGNIERITIDGDWPAANIIRVPVPELGRIGRTHVLLHREAAEPFQKLMRAWANAGLLDEITTWNGAFVTRYKRGKGPKLRNGVLIGGGVAELSNHSWGAAFDVNARRYPLGYKVPALDPMRDLARVANEFRFFWGWRFPVTPRRNAFRVRWVSGNSRARALACRVDA